MNKNEKLNRIIITEMTNQDDNSHICSDSERNPQNQRNSMTLCDLFNVAVDYDLIIISPESLAERRPCLSVCMFT
jgi:hypothetical protein